MTSSTTPPQTGQLLKIGEVCHRVGLSLRTVRYYEEVGLLTPTDRSPGGFRLYSETDVRRLSVLKGMKPLGLTLDEIRELMHLLDFADDRDTPTGGDVDGALEGLRNYTSRAEQRVEQLLGHVEEVRRLHGRILGAIEDLRRSGSSAGSGG